MVKFSIITVCLNSEKTIQRCLESVKSQKYRNFEHIIIDGLSNDNTLEIIKNYQIDLCVSEKDNGIYDAMNKGISLAQGAYILFLNSDDEILPDFLKCANESLFDQDFLSTSINMCHDDIIRQWNIKPYNHGSFMWRMPIPHAGLIVKKSVLISLNSFDLTYKIAADFDFIAKLLSGDYKGVYNNRCLLNFHAGGASEKFEIIRENHLVRNKYFNNVLFVYIALTLDYLRYFKWK
jgi:glycosyltransferase involved in cell wall biosynthesis